MEPITGIREFLAITRATEWNQAAQCGPGDGVLYLKGQAKPSVTVETRKSRGIAYSTDGTRGQIACPAQYEHELLFQGLELLIAMFMGTPGVPVQQGATAAWLKLYQWNPSLYGYFVTTAKSMINYIEEVPTAKVVGITLSGSVGAEPLKLVVDMIGTNRETQSEINTLETFENCTLGFMGPPVMFAQLKFRMNNRDGAALEDTDEIYPSSFTFSAKRSDKGEYTGQYRTADAVPADLIDEPSQSGDNNGQPDIKLTLEFPIHLTDTYISDCNNDVRKKLDITATGPQIEGEYNYQQRLRYPHLQMTNVQPTDDNGRVKEPLEFLVHGTLTEVAGMAGLLAPFDWQEISKHQTDPLG